MPYIVRKKAEELKNTLPTINHKGTYALALWNLMSKVQWRKWLEKDVHNNKIKKNPWTTSRNERSRFGMVFQILWLDLNNVCKVIYDDFWTGNIEEHVYVGLAWRGGGTIKSLFS